MSRNTLGKPTKQSGSSVETDLAPTISMFQQSWYFGKNAISAYLLVALAAFRFIAALSVNRNADDANNLLAGADMIRGNWRLHGWTMAPDNYVPTDVLAQGLASLLFGLRPVVMDLVEAVIWAIITVFGVRLATRDLVGGARLTAATTVIALILFTCSCNRPGYESITGVGSHGFTLLLTLAVFGLATHGRSVRHRRHLWMLGGSVLIGSFADPIFLTIAVLPLLVSCVLAFRREAGTSRINREMLTTGGITLAAVVASQMLLELNVKTGGFQSVGFTIRFTSFNDALAHLAFAANGVFSLFGADFFGRVLTKNHLINQIVFLLRFPFVLALIVVLILGGTEMIRTLYEWPYGKTVAKTALPSSPVRTMDRAPDSIFLDQLLWISILCCITETVITTVIIDVTAIRFFLPVAMAGSVLIARRLSVIPIFSFYAATAAMISIVLGLLALLHGPARPTFASQEYRQLARLLQGRGLQHGYSGYWSGGLLTVLTHGNVRCLALVDDGSGPLHPFAWLTNLDWYSVSASTWHGKVFFIAADQPASPIELGQQRILQLFGKPGEIIPVGTLKIDIYDTTTSPLTGLLHDEHHHNVS